MKKLSRCLWMGLVAVSLLSLAGCGKKLENQIIGSWQTTDEESGHPYIMVYRKDGEGVIKSAIGEIKFKWEVAKTGNNTITRTANLFGKEESTVREITIEGDNLTDRDTDGKTVLKFVRVADDAEVPQVDLGAEMKKSQEDSDAADGKLTPTGLKNATEDEKKFISMYSDVMGHLKTLNDFFDKARLGVEDGIGAGMQEEFDAAQKLHMNHFGTPPRFYEADSKLRAALKKYETSVAIYRRRREMGELEEAARLLHESITAYSAQLTALHKGQ